MPYRPICLAVLLALLASSAQAQISAEPSEVSVSVPQGQSAEAMLTLSNTGAEALRVALSHEPADGAWPHAEEPGTLLFARGTGVVYWVAQAPDGRVFAADSRDPIYEYTAELDFVRVFEHPLTEFQNSTAGLAFDPTGNGGSGGEGEGTLWWTDKKRDGFAFPYTLLVEGYADPDPDGAYEAGDPTGRSLALPLGDPDCSPATTGNPVALALDPEVATSSVEGGGPSESGAFYYLNFSTKEVMAVDRSGALLAGYPVDVHDYARPAETGGGGLDCFIGNGLDAHTLSHADGLGQPLGGEPVFEATFGVPGEHPQNRVTRVIVTDREGRNLGVETPLYDLATPDGFGSVLEIQDVVRSRLDPSVLYLAVLTGVLGNFRDWVYAVRASPLPPPWLRFSVLHELAASGKAGDEVEVALSFDAAGLEPGVYRSVVAVRAGDGIGPIVAEVPVVLTVTDGTDAEDEAEPEDSARLSAYPNPSRATGAPVTVALALADAAEVSVAVYDVLGRRVALLHEGLLSAGEQTLRFDAGGLPGGVYLVRIESSTLRLSRRITLLR